jgi:pimeloyl-ACP methyl ester carboxylesterase
MMRRAALAAVLALIPAAAAPQDRMVTLPDHRRIHLNCSGAGKVTVILESGFAASGEAWEQVQPKLAPTMRVCSYDRAGIGRSDPGPLPRDGAAIVGDLDAALKAAKVRGPFIGVGHSAGGLYIRLFAARRASEMKGLVLVDPSIEHQVARVEAAYGKGAGSVEGIRKHAENCLRIVSRRPIDAKDPLYPGCVPGPEKPEAHAQALKPYTWSTQVSEIETLFTATSDQIDAAQPRVRDIPVIILTADQGGMAPFHAQVKARFTHGEQRIIPSGHMMFFDRPQAIVTAVQDLARR